VNPFGTVAAMVLETDFHTFFRSRRNHGRFSKTIRMENLVLKDIPGP